MKFLFKHLKEYKFYLFFNIFLAFGITIIELGLPMILGKIIDKAIPDKNFALVKYYLFLIILIIIIGTIMRLWITYNVVNIITKIISNIRKTFIKKSFLLKQSELEYIEPSTLVTRAVIDGHNILIFLQAFLGVGYIYTIMFFSSLYMAFNINFVLSLFIFINIPLILIGIFITYIITVPLSERQQKLIDKINELVKETISGIKYIKVFNKEDLQNEKFNNINKDYQNVISKINLILSIASPTFSLLISVIAVLVVNKGIKLVIFNELQIGQLIVFLTFMFNALLSLVMLTIVLSLYPKVTVSINRIQEVINKITDDNEEKDKETIKEINKIEFRNVSLKNNNDIYILKNLNFILNKKENIVFFGSNSSGKTSIIKLILGMYNNKYEGQILINNIPIENINIKIFHNTIGYVSQKSFLFSATIRKNLVGWNNKKDNEIFDVLEKVNMLDFLNEKDNKLDFKLNEEGNNLSGGQKKRLLIARALLKNPSMFIFDDAFSALDKITSNDIKEKIKPLIKDKLNIFVTHNPKNFKIFGNTKVLFICHGEIVDYNTHENLYRNNKLYRVLIDQ